MLLMDVNVSVSLRSDASLCAKEKRGKTPSCLTHRQERDSECSFMCVCVTHPKDKPLNAYFLLFFYMIAVAIVVAAAAAAVRR